MSATPQLSVVVPVHNEEDNVAPLVEDGLVRRDGARLMATAQGRPVLNALLRALLA